jgi:hypothetical protein
MSFLDKIVLPARDEALVRSYYGKHPAYLEERLRMAKAGIYRQDNLVQVQKNSNNVGRCMNEGSQTWARKDGQDITDQDVEAVLLQPLGQEVRVSGRTPHQVTIYWFCDSGD